MSTPSRDTHATDRLAGLPPELRASVQRAREAIAQGRSAAAQPTLDAALVRHPDHPELLQLRALIDHHAGRFSAAIDRFRRAAALWPDDGMIQSNLGAALAQSGDVAAATEAFRRATELDPTLVDAWFNLGRALEMASDAAGAHAAFSAVVELSPQHRTARVLRAEAAKMLGRLGESEAELRDVLREEPHDVSAWVALANLKSFRADDSDLAALARLHGDASVPPSRRTDLAFAYAAALEAHGDYERAFATFVAANSAKRRTLRWNAAAVSRLVDDILVAFDGLEPDADASPGHGVVFLVGVARSGSTLAEQILAAHPDVDATGENGLLIDVLRRESDRRGVRFPHWVRDATSSDWSRLADDYLARLAPLRSGRPHATDKTLVNWQIVGAIRRMLPAARIVHCVRDPLEAAWSCYKHNFAQQVWSYDFAEIGAYFRDCERAMRVWSESHREAILEHRHEALIENPESAVRALLAHVGLPYDARCLRFHEAEGEVRTASAAQVRRPLAAQERVTPRYGALLDPLRAMLAAPLMH